jgi:L-lysine exporter family protein LysE/ArgO
MLPVGPAAEGFLVGGSLIVAIGAQNAFVLRQGLARRHVAAVVAFCGLSDVALILAGVAGLGALVQAAPALLAALTWGGAAFLAWYGVRALRRAMRPDALAAAEREAAGLGAALAQAAAFTFLNPHVFLDTVVLVGAVSARHAPPTNWIFAAGAGTASILWFAGLGFGARLLAPVFARPSAWRALDLLIACVMFALAAALALSRF